MTVFPGETHYAKSADGTSIGWRQFGTGPAIVITHGSLATSDEWLPVAGILAEDHTVFLVDRRGRGLSGDAQYYDLETEVADLQAVLNAAGAGATLLAHSYGAVCAAATAAAGASISALVLYEPPFPVSGTWETARLPLVAEALKEKNYDQALVTILSLLVVPDDIIEDLRATPFWAPMAALTPTFQREYSVLNSLADDLDRFKAIRERTLVFLGGDSPQRRIDAVELLTSSLPDVTLVDLPGQHHYAHVAQPEVIAKAVQSFLSAS
ncbi:alpha/beta fold hydrolase [Streptomyces sp. NPDC002574]|uniref:alpha/beta fold hydrolase n=1 Tax=Streptomyces sp. NPDC002574 TaxID=3364652 RepID=UPI0036B731B6